MANQRHWQRSSPAHPCPVCNNTKGKCSWNDKGVTCHYQESDKPGRGAIPGWYHSILSNEPRPTATAADLRQRPAILDQQANAQSDVEDQAAPELLHTVYSDLLASLTVTAYHLKTLTDQDGDRRLTLVEVQALQVKSIPKDTREICAKLARKFGRENLLKVPGFFVNRRGQLQLNCRGGGLFIPVDSGSGITGLRIRLDQPGDGPRYYWLSSANKGGPGPKAAAAVYHPLNVLASRCGKVGITEGEFKAFITAQRRGYPVIAVPGTGSWQSAGAVELAKSMGEKVVIFYDSEINQHTLDQRNALADTLVGAGLQVYIAHWDMTFKGIDDLLLAGQNFRTSVYVPGLGGLMVDQVIDEQYFPASILPQKKVLLIKSPKGTGKTEWLVQLRKSLRSKESMLVIGHRVALLEEGARRLDLDFYADYKGKKVDRAGLTKSDRLAICLDSLIHLEKATNKTYVILDEVEQVLRHLIGNTIKSKRQRVVAMFRVLLKEADHIIGLDADVSLLTYRFFERLFGADSIEVVVNTFKKTNAAPLFQYQNKDELTACLIEKLGQGHKAYVATNSKEEARRLERALAARFPDLIGLTITQNNSADPFIRKIIRNLNEHAAGYDYLIASPTLGTGVDISLEHFDLTFVIGRQNSTTHSDLLQHAARNRKAKEMYCWIQPGERSEPTDSAYWEKYCLDKADQTGLLLDEEHLALTGKRKANPFEIDYLKLWADCRAQEKASTNSLAANFYEQACREGHMILEANAHGEVQEAVRLRRDAKDELEKERVEEILEAPSISDKEANELAVKAYKTKEERAREERYRIETFYGQEITRELIAADDKGKTMRRLTSFLIFNQKLDPVAMDKHLLGDDQKLLPDGRHYTLLRERRYQFTNALKLEGFQGGKEFSSEDLSGCGFVEWARENAAVLYRDLGLTVKSDIDEKPVQLVAAYLSQLGLKLATRRAGGRGDQKRFYKLDPASLSLMQNLAESRLKVIEARPVYGREYTPTEAAA